MRPVGYLSNKNCRKVKPLSENLLKICEFLVAMIFVSFSPKWILIDVS